MAVRNGAGHLAPPDSAPVYAEQMRRFQSPSGMFTNEFNGLPRQGQHFFFAKKKQKTLTWAAVSCLTTRLNEQKFFGSFFSKKNAFFVSALFWLPYFSEGHCRGYLPDADRRRRRRHGDRRRQGIEERTRKLFEICRPRDIPIITFVNKFDREARSPFGPRLASHQVLRVRVGRRVRSQRLPNVSDSRSSFDVAS